MVQETGCDLNSLSFGRRIGMKQMRWLGTLAIGLAVLAVGIFMLASGETFIRILLMVLGVLSILSGIASIATVGRYGFGRYNRNATMVKGMLGLVIGVLAVVMPLFTAQATWMVFVYVLAAQLLLSAVVSLGAAFAVGARGVGSSRLSAEGWLSLLFAVVLFLFPKSIGQLLLTILGIVVIVVGLTLVVIALVAARKKDTVTVVEGKSEVVQ
jgi:uncharacterized membrane protein HdeD (DUF308 family)